MNYISCSLREFIKNTRNKKVLCFGAGSYFQVMCCDFSRSYPEINLSGVIDNNEDKHGRTVGTAGFAAEVYSPENALEKFDFSETVVLITTAQLRAVKEQLGDIDCFSNAEVYSYYDLKRNSICQVDDVHKGGGEPKIPPKLHYCWFGRKEIPEGLKKCINSWKRLCPDYDIKRWDESNYDVAKTPFLKEAYEKKCYALVSDYTRLDIIYNEGGIYFDTDVEIIRNIDFLRLNNGIVATEVIGGINTGSGLGAARHHPILKEFKKIYEHNRSFAEFSTTTNIGRETGFFYGMGYEPNGKKQTVGDMTICPHYILSHKAYETGESLMTGTSVSVHLMDGSWRDNEEL